MNDLKVIVTTHDKFMWALRPFAYLFNTYWSANQPVTALVETHPDFRMPGNFSFHAVDVDSEKWPKDKWSNGLIKYLNGIPEQFILILLEDYWLNRTVDIRGVNTLHEYMTIHRNILRIDLTMDRLFANGPKYPNDDPEYDHYGHYDLLSRPGS